ncbi:hypothetical protein POM88_053833 [Heracleum sosnowskyi]|uniref:Myb-like DNA-binding domain containing protein n=1 Tax=Heracleum sosnowskyi TaxID=360622 RepID=A0AAD8GNA2_9APIA|nr:hypothetical protein POM88_053833 [Heracleum sosnowskyi]
MMLPTKSNITSVVKDSEVFKCNLVEGQPISVSRDDIAEFLRMSCLNIPILQIFMMAYDRAAIKFRGVEADINFVLEDYEEDLKQVAIPPSLGNDDIAPYSVIHNFSQRLQDLGANVQIVKWNDSPHFKDKTTRQCRRRWYTYLKSDFKKGGWSPEEDMLLCEKIFGNRWTEIAKVVSGRTDNAMKNRFSTLFKKRAKVEALEKENNPSYLNPNNKRVIFQDVSTADVLSKNGGPLRKLRRDHIFDLTENSNPNIRLEKECANSNPQVRPPLAELD